MAMSKILLISRTGFSDQEANGITMKVLLSAWHSDEKAVFYCDVQPPDFSAACECFRTTDMDMLKAFVRKGRGKAFSESDAQETVSCRQTTDAKLKSAVPKSVPKWMKQRKYDFRLKWLREILWSVSPWGHRKLEKWIDKVSPDAVIYMVGESIYLDKLVLHICQKRNLPLVLYNCEAFRLIDIQRRKGLERKYYKYIKRLYAKLNRLACFAIYNCEMLKEGYEQAYSSCPPSMVAYNSSDIGSEEYRAQGKPVITYFGNLGVGRTDSLIKMAKVLSEIDSTFHIDVYGKARQSDEDLIHQQKNLSYHGFISAEKLQAVIDHSDILLHTESFQPDIAEKLQYAFSTKIAQCLHAGRCLLSYIPKESASAQYLLKEECAVVATNEIELKEAWKLLLFDSQKRTEYAEAAREIGEKNHDAEITSKHVRTSIESAISKANS